MIVCGTGPLVALSNERDEHCFTANNLFRDLHMAGETLVLPATLLAETCRRHFPSITPKDGGHFTLLPESL